MLFFTFHVLVTVVEAIVNARFVGVVEVPVSIYTVNNVKDKVYLWPINWCCANIVVGVILKSILLFKNYIFFINI